MSDTRIITLLTDFGTADGYVGAVKGVLKTSCGGVDIVDISHDITPYQISQAAFTLLNYYNCFPKDTIHLIVIDPGVGSERPAVIVKTDNYYFVGPDNGIFTYLSARENYTAYAIDPKTIIKKETAHTFHARDLFAPVAAKIALGMLPGEIGKKTDSLMTEMPLQFSKKGNEIALRCIARDHFGNIISGFTRHDLDRLGKKKITSVRFKNFKTDKINRYYGEEDPGQPLVLWNSLDFLEIAVTQGSAAQYFAADILKDEIIIIIE